MDKMGLYVEERCMVGIVGLLLLHIIGFLRSGYPSGVLAPDY